MSSSIFGNSRTCFYSLLRESGSLTLLRGHADPDVLSCFYSLLRESGSLTIYSGKFVATDLVSIRCYARAGH